jgi:serine protease AprX
MARITVNGVSWDPVEEEGAGRVTAARTAAASSSNYILVQTEGPLTEQQREQLAALGASVREYVPDNTYLCEYAPADLDGIRALDFVTWAGDYHTSLKIASTLRPRVSTSRADGSETDRASARKPRAVELVLHDGVDGQSEELRGRIAAAARHDPDDLQVSRGKVRLTVPEDRLDDLAEIDEVRAVVEAPQRQLFNAVARTILNVDAVVNGTSYDGDGEIVAVADTGFDRGSRTDVHPAFKGRVVRLYALGRPNKANDPDGHGTHVAGSVLGDGDSPTMGGEIRGTAPGARLILQSTLDQNGDLGGIPIDLRDLFEPAYDDGARVHTNSWGNSVPGLPYDPSSAEIDAMVWTHQDLVICFAAGNDGIDRNRNGVVDAGSIGSEAAAKNCITVGASESLRSAYPGTYGGLWPNDYPVPPLSSDRLADDPDGMVAFSSRGPTREGRIKPDVVAPGSCILSTRSRDLVVAPIRYGVSSDPQFYFSSGTSMATPLVAGCVAALREALIKSGTVPSAALLKALLINGAVELPGQYSPSEAGPSPNNNSGFGRVDLGRSINAAVGTGDAGFEEAGPLTQGAEETFTIDIPADGTSRTLTISLVWTDPPGAALQNDLDLVVRAGGQERHGNAGTSTRFDRVNNVEQISWTDIPAGTATVAVQAFRITLFPQPYALAWQVV